MRGGKAGLLASTDNIVKSYNKNVKDDSRGFRSIGKIRHFQNCCGHIGIS
jgi:hypothetical protein